MSCNALFTRTSGVLNEQHIITDGAADTSTIFGATTGMRNIITAVTIIDTTGTGGYVDFILDGSSKKYSVPFGTTGCVHGNGVGALFATDVGVALQIDPSAALTSVIVSLTGYKGY